MTCCFPKMDPMEIDEPEPPPKPIKKRKKAIPKTLRQAVWNTYIGDSIGKTKCPVCQCHDITQLNFHCGHVIPEAEGGPTQLDNLRPICASCNLSMGKKNLYKFKDRYFG